MLPSSFVGPIRPPAGTNLGTQRAPGQRFADSAGPAGPVLGLAMALVIAGISTTRSQPQRHRIVQLRAEPEAKEEVADAPADAADAEAQDHYSSTRIIGRRRSNLRCFVHQAGSFLQEESPDAAGDEEEAAEDDEEEAAAEECLDCDDLEGFFSARVLKEGLFLVRDAHACLALHLQGRSPRNGNVLIVAACPSPRLQP